MDYGKRKQIRFASVGRGRRTSGRAESERERESENRTWDAEERGCGECGVFLEVVILEHSYADHRSVTITTSWED